MIEKRSAKRGVQRFAYDAESRLVEVRNENGSVVRLAYHGADGIISAISCNATFKGNYENKLWPGMTVSDVLKVSKVQVAWSGFVQIDQGHRPLFAGVIR